MFKKIYVADTENTVPKSLLYHNDDVLTTVKEENDVFHYDAQSVKILKQKSNRQASEFVTETWAFAIAPISEKPTKSSVVIWNNIDEPINELITNPEYSNTLIMFHNMAYDGKQILDNLLHIGYEYKECVRLTKTNIKKGNLDDYDKGVEPNTFSVSISGQGQWYEIIIATNTKRGEFLKEIHREENGEVITEDVWVDAMEYVVIRDSLKILPFSVEKIAEDLDTKFGKLSGTIDYTVPRYAGWKITNKEKEYIQNDVLVMAEAIAKIRKKGVTEMTIGSHAFKQFKKMRYKGVGKKQSTNSFIEQRFRNEFVEIDHETDKFLRKAYYGAVTYNKFDDNLVNLTDPNFEPNEGTRQLSKEEQQLLKEGKFYIYKYDVNSMYPTVMFFDEERASKDPLFDFKYPKGKPNKIEDVNHFVEVANNDELCYIVKVKLTMVVKQNHMNWFQAKETTSEFMSADFIKAVYTPTEFTLTEIDWEQLQKYYEITSFKFIDGYWFSSTRGIFNKYISYWYEQKNKAKAEENQVMYLLSKLMLNNLYGKFAQKLVRDSAIPTLVNDKLSFLVKEYELNTGYVPLGAYITAYARRYLVESIQANWDRFFYCDTDSMAILGEAKGLTIGGELGDWDIEGIAQIARFVRQKTYAMYYHPVKNQKPLDEIKLDIKACGCPASTKTRLLYDVTKENGEDDFIFLPLKKDKQGNIISKKRPPLEVIERFTYGLVEAGKLSKKTVKGGAILFETTFAIL